MPTNLDFALYEAALIGLKQQRAEIDTKIATVEGVLRRRGGRGSSAASTAPQKQTTHRISAEGRARIAAAQGRRWAAAKKGGRNSLKTPAAPAKVRTAAE
jgi:hypothetical protein